MIYFWLDLLKGTILHPQWLSDRFHKRSRRCLEDFREVKVLDIGSGDAKYAEKIDASCELVSLDYPTTSTRYRSLPAVFATAAKLPFGDDSFDVVLLLEVLEHVEDDRAVIAEISRVMRGSGTFVFSIPFSYPVHDAPFDFRRYSEFGAQALLQRQGFDVVSITKHGNGFVVAMQLFNLAVLECAQGAVQRMPLLGLVAGLLAYSICLTVNLLALPLVWLKHPERLYFGVHCIARKSI
jgi:SAM-dependent methyltransferase